MTEVSLWLVCIFNEDIAAINILVIAIKERSKQDHSVRLLSSYDLKEICETLEAESILESKGTCSYHDLHCFVSVVFQWNLFKFLQVVGRSWNTIKTWFENVWNIQFGGGRVICPLNDHYLALIEGVRFDLRELQFNLWNLTSILLAQVKQPDVCLVDLGIFMVHIDDSTNQSLSVLHRKAIVVELIGFELFFQDFLDQLEVFLGALNSPRCSQVEYVKAFKIVQNLHWNASLVIVRAWDLGNLLVECVTILTLRLSRWK